MHGLCCTCIVPFYNEGGRVLQTVKKLREIEEFDSIILVDDGSDDNGAAEIEKHLESHPQDKIYLLKHAYNKGKSAAAQTGLDKVVTEYVFLFDADIQNIKIEEIQYAISEMYKNRQHDMAILRRISARWYIKFLYRELVLSGQRMLKTKDLKKVFEKDVQKYQLEVAINHYMKKENKTIVWYPFSGSNTLKQKKNGFLRGCIMDLKMFSNIFRYQGFLHYIKNSLRFPLENKKNTKTRKAEL